MRDDKPKIAIVTSGILPVPAVLGGAVENLIDSFIEENERTGKYELHVFSVHADAAKDAARGKKFVQYSYVRAGSLAYKLCKKIFQYTHKTYYYNYHLEFFLHNILPKIKSGRFDLVLIENRPGYVVPISQVTDAKLMLRIHTDLFNQTTPYAEDILEHVDRVIAVSDYINRQVSAIKDANKVVTVHNGIDLGRFSVTRNNALRQKLGLDTKDFVLVYCGRIVPEKGIRELIQAMNLLEPSIPVKLMIVGGSFYGDQLGDNPFIRELKQLSANLSDRIIFTGYVNYAEIPAYLSVADVAVVPSICEEAFGLSVLEPMAIGLPIITTNAGGIPEVASDTNGIIVGRDEQMPQHLSEAITKLFKNPEQVKEMGAQSQILSKRFSKQKHVQNLINALDDVLLSRA